MRITLFLRKTSKESILLARKSYLDCSLDMRYTRGGIWKGDTLVADRGELEEMEASEIHVRRLNAKEVLTLMNGGKFRFPLVDGTVKLS